MIRKNDKVTIDLDAFIKYYKPETNWVLRNKIFEEMKKRIASDPNSNYNKIITHIKNNSIVIVTGVRCGGSYLNLKFDDGFECGMDAKFAIKKSKKN